MPDPPDAAREEQPGDLMLKARKRAAVASERARQARKDADRARAEGNARVAERYEREAELHERAAALHEEAARLQAQHIAEADAGIARPRMDAGRIGQAAADALHRTAAEPSGDG